MLEVSAVRAEQKKAIRSMSGMTRRVSVGIRLIVPS